MGGLVLLLEDFRGFPSSYITVRLSLLRTDEGESNVEARHTIYIHSKGMIVCFLYYFSCAIPFERRAAAAAAQGEVNGFTFLIVSFHSFISLAALPSHLIISERKAKFSHIACVLLNIICCEDNSVC